MKLALIHWHNNRFEAHNQEGRMICHRPTFNQIFGTISHYDYVPVNSRSAAGQGILWKMSKQSPSMIGVRV